MKMSENGRELLARWEGVRTQVYKDSAGLPTIGVGHLLTEGESHCGKIVIGGVAVAYDGGLSEAQVLALLGQDLTRFEDAVNSAVTVVLNQNQFDALVSFSFNVGVGAFEKSTLLRVLNQGRYNEVPDQLRRWIKAAQAAWRQFRDAHLASLFPAEDKVQAYGSVYGECVQRAARELTCERIEQLYRWVKGVPEGEVCAGSLPIQ